MTTETFLSCPNFKWYDLEEPHLEDVEKLNSEFNLPLLLVQDTLRPEHLPKYEETDDGHFMMLRSYDTECSSEATTVQGLTRKLALFVRGDNLITIHRVEFQFLLNIAEKGKKNPAAANMTMVNLVHQIVLGVIRSYEAPIQDLQDLYDEFEADVLSKSIEKMDTAKIYQFRRKLFVIKRIIRQTTDALVRSREFWGDSTSLLQDLKENLDQIYYQLDEVSDNFEHLFELHIAINDQKANEVMKVLTVFSTILLPLNFLASFYGMNFTNLPGLDSYYALVGLMVLMALLTIISIWYFRRKGWFSTTES